MTESQRSGQAAQLDGDSTKDCKRASSVIVDILQGTQCFDAVQVCLCMCEWVNSHRQAPTSSKLNLKIRINNLLCRYFDP